MISGRKEIEKFAQIRLILEAKFSTKFLRAIFMIAWFRVDSQEMVHSFSPYAVFPEKLAFLTP